MTEKSTQRHIICMKWGTKYGPEYVNRLYAMVRRHLTGDFNMVCLTDDSTGIRSEVQCLPIPALDLPPGIPERGWTKLASFTQDLHGLRGTALFLDVDVVIVGSMDGFFEVPGDFMIIHDYTRPWRITGNSSVFTDTSWVPTPMCLRTSATTLTAFANSSEMNKRICQTSCTSKASWPTGLQSGALVSSTTAFPLGPATIGLPRKFQATRAWSFFMASAIHQMHWRANAIENSDSSSQRFGWLITGKNKKRRSDERLFCGKLFCQT